jgi:hypothetical protein
MRYTVQTTIFGTLFKKTTLSPQQSLILTLFIHNRTKFGVQRHFCTRFRYAFGKFSLRVVAYHIQTLTQKGQNLSSKHRFISNHDGIY